MKRVIIILSVLVATLLAGCSTLPVAQLPTTSIPQGDRVSFMDQRSSPSSGSFMFAEGNVYSCHYAIRKIDDKAMQPDRMTALHSYLDSQIFKDNKSHTVIVKRFDVYWNQHVAAESQMFGVAGEAISSSGYVIGCKGAEEGEYYSAEVPGKNYSAIVVYLDTVIDGQDDNVRTVYPVLEDADTKARWPDNLRAAIDKTFATLGNLVANYSSGRSNG